MKIIPTNLYKSKLKRLRTDNERKRIKMLVDHYTKGTRLSGTDKASEGVYSGKNIRHFHLSEPDTLLIYQVTKNVLVLLDIATHAECFGDNEADFLASIEDDLIEQRSMRDLVTLLVEIDETIDPSPIIINFRQWLAICEAENRIMYIIKDQKTYRTFVGDDKRWSSREKDGEIFPDYASAERKKEEIQLKFPRRKFFTQLIS